MFCKLRKDVLRSRYLGFCSQNKCIYKIIHPNHTSQTSIPKTKNHLKYNIQTPVSMFGITHFELKALIIGGYNRGP